MSLSNTLVRLAPLSLGLGLLACSDDTSKPADTLSPDTADVADTSAPDTAEPDASETDDADAPQVCEHPCINNFGKNDKSLCPTPQSEWECVEGCCVAAFKCKADADCAVRGFEEEQCDDERFACLCNEGDGTCFTWFCGVDDDCADGEVCAGGRCLAAPATEGLEVRILERQSVLTPGTTYQLHAEAFDPDNRDAVVAVAATWSSSDTAVATVDGNGLVTAGANAGVVTITAKNGDKTDTLTLENVVPAGTDLTVVVRTELTWEPVVGHYAVIDADNVVTAAELPADGIIRFPTTGKAPYDLHVFGTENDWVSWLDLAPSTTLYLPIPRTLYARVEVDQAGEFTEASEMRNVGIITGTPDLSDYVREGELDLVLTTTGLSSALFDFSLPVLLGSDVKRYVDPDSNIPRVDKTEPLTLPGGVVFNLAGPAVPSYVLTAPRGTHRLWSIGGRLDLNEIASYSGTIVDAVAGGDLDFTKIVGAVFPLFKNFWSGYADAVTVTDLDDPSKSIGFTQKLTTPMALTVNLDVPALPSLGERGTPPAPTWADGLFLLSGAQTLDGFMVPLGLNGGADTADKENNPADGMADGDERTPEKDPFALPIAPLHSGLQGPYTRYLVAAVAAAIPANGSDPRPSSGSATLARWAPGERPPERHTLPAFLGFPLENAVDFDLREVMIGAQEGADIQRVLLKGKRGEHWTFYGVSAGEGIRIPHPASIGLTTTGDRFIREALESVLVNSLDFAAGTDVTALGRPGGLQLDVLLGLVERVSFIDIKNQAFTR